MYQKDKQQTKPKTIEQNKQTKNKNKEVRKSNKGPKKMIESLYHNWEKWFLGEISTAVPKWTDNTSSVGNFVVSASKQVGKISENL